MIFIIILHIKNGNQYSQNDLGVRKLDKKCTFHVIGVLVISMHLLLLYILEMLACISSIKTLPINIDSLSPNSNIRTSSKTDQKPCQKYI